MNARRKLFFFGKGGGAALDPDYQAVLDYATAQSYTLPSASQQTAQNKLVLDLKAAGVWNKLYFLYLVATDGDVNFAGLDMKNPATREWTLINSPTFVPNEKILGDGISAGINTNFNPVLHADADFANNNTFGAFQTEDVEGGLKSIIGNFTLSSRSEIDNDFDNGRFVYFNHRTTAFRSASSASQQGFIATRSNASDYADLLQNKSLIGTDNNSSGSPNNVNFALLQRAGGAIPNDGGISIAFASKYLTDQEWEDFNDIFTTYKAAI